MFLSLQSNLKFKMKNSFMILGNKIENFLQKVDDIAPNPWYIDGVEQARPVTQLGTIIGVLLGLIICYFL